MTTDILVVDDEPDIRELIGDILKDEGHGVRLAWDSDSALQEINRAAREEKASLATGVPMQFYRTRPAAAGR